MSRFWDTHSGSCVSDKHTRVDEHHSRREGHTNGDRGRTQRCMGIEVFREAAVQHTAPAPNQHTTELHTCLTASLTHTVFTLTDEIIRLFPGSLTVTEHTGQSDSGLFSLQYRKCDVNG
ncbi:unnamed protein product [Leuciscus chuanchicus]